MNLRILTSMKFLGQIKHCVLDQVRMRGLLVFLAANRLQWAAPYT